MNFSWLFWNGIYWTWLQLKDFKKRLRLKEELVEMAGKQWRKLSNVTLLKSKLQRQKALSSQVTCFIYCFGTLIFTTLTLWMRWQLEFMTETNLFKMSGLLGYKFYFSLLKSKLQRQKAFSSQVTRFIYCFGNLLSTTFNILNDATAKIHDRDD